MVNVPDGLLERRVGFDIERRLDPPSLETKTAPTRRLFPLARETRDTAVRDTAVERLQPGPLAKTMSLRSLQDVWRSPRKAAMTAPWARAR